MPAPVRTPTISPNNLISNSLTQTQQFQELFIQLKEWLVASGGTVQISNGGGVAGAGDNIGTTQANVTTGAAGTGAWAVLNFSTSTISNSAHNVLIYVDDNAAPFQQIGWRHGPGTWSGGNTTTLPTLAGLATTAQLFNLNPFTTNVNIRWSSWRTTTPNRPQRFAVKQDGVGRFETWIELISNDGSNGSGNERWATMLSSAAGSDAGAAAQWQSSAQWNAIDAAASADTATLGDSMVWRVLSNLTAGLDGFGNAHPGRILIGQNLATGRSIGTIVDLYAVPQNMAFGVAIDAAEVAGAQDPLRVCAGDVAIYWPNGVTIS